MTWKEFKDIVEAQGVRDESVINFIEVDGLDPITADPVDKDGQGWRVYSA